MFTKVHVVRKLDAANDQNVNRIFSLIQTICKNGSGGISIPIVEERNINNETLVIAIGGDGTMLEALRLAHKYHATATGINLGTVGFLTDFINDQGQLVNDLYDAIHEIGWSPVEQRVALQCHLHDKGTDSTPFDRLAFNEFVISNKLSDHLIKYTLFIGNRCAGVHRANALIVGTPTGSTAYSLSAGGGLLLPSMEAMQIIPVAPINLTSRPIIIPSNEDIRISVETKGEWLLKADGTTLGTYENDHFIDTQVVITQSDHKVEILHSKHWSFFDMLNQKLGWKNK